MKGRAPRRRGRAAAHQPQPGRSSSSGRDGYRRRGAERAKANAQWGAENRTMTNFTQRAEVSCHSDRSGTGTKDWNSCRIFSKSAWLSANFVSPVSKFTVTK